MEWHSGGSFECPGDEPNPTLEYRRTSSRFAGDQGDPASSHRRSSSSGGRSRIRTRCAPTFSGRPEVWHSRCRMVIRSRSASSCGRTSSPSGSSTSPNSGTSATTGVSSVKSSVVNPGHHGRCRNRFATEARAKRVSSRTGTPGRASPATWVATIAPRCQTAADAPATTLVRYPLVDRAQGSRKIRHAYLSHR